MKKILVLTNSEDGIHSESVIDKLEEIGEKVFRFDSDKLGEGGLSVSYHLTGAGSYFTASCEGRTIDSREIGSVWYRRPNLFNWSIQDPTQKQFAEEEITSYLDGLWFCLTDAYWLNSPHNLDRARKKTLQLQIARDIGFNVPRTLISNNPEEAKSFLGSIKGGAITKTLNPVYFEKGDDSYNIPTTLLTPEQIANIELTRNLPTLFQEQIEKEYELRVTVVGSRVFAAKIDSQALKETSIDWRNPRYLGKLPHSLVELPQEVSSMCLSLTREFGLNYGAIDLIVDKESKYVFLEINPNGQWYWIEHLTGSPISRTIALELSLNKRT